MMSLAALPSGVVLRPPIKDALLTAYEEVGDGKDLSRNITCNTTMTELL